jgi:hypothetical protein
LQDFSEKFLQFFILPKITCGFSVFIFRVFNGVFLSQLILVYFWWRHIWTILMPGKGGKGGNYAKERWILPK